MIFTWIHFKIFIPSQLAYKISITLFIILRGATTMEYKYFQSSKLSWKFFIKIVAVVSGRIMGLIYSKL